MKTIRTRVEEIRSIYPCLQSNNLPIDILRFSDLDLKLDMIPFPGLSRRFRISAAINPDGTAILLDDEDYLLYDDRGEEDWRSRRLRFSVAHEIGHYFLHRDLPPESSFKDRVSYEAWLKDYGGENYRIEKEANEFAGALLVPVTRLQGLVDYVLDMTKDKKTNLPLPRTNALREVVCQMGAEMFQVNDKVIDVRLNREEIWIQES